MYAHFFWVDQTDYGFATTFGEFVWKQNIPPYPQNQEEFIQQCGGKLHDFTCVIYKVGPLWRQE